MAARSVAMAVLLARSASVLRGPGWLWPTTRRRAGALACLCHFATAAGRVPPNLVHTVVAVAVHTASF